jgi:hypothetical protein
MLALACRRGAAPPEPYVAFVVNRSTDFFWASDDFTGLRKAYESGAVYMAPNPFTYATRSERRMQQCSLLYTLLRWSPVF